MKTVSVTELKAKLSEYVAAVKTGEEVVVTERGRAVARVVAYDSPGVPARLEALASRGLVRLAQDKVSPANPQVTDPRGRLLEALLSDRNETP